MQLLSCISILASLLCVSAKDTRYEGDQLIRFNVISQAQVEVLRNIPGLQIWTHAGIKPGNVDVRVAAKDASILRDIGIDYKVIVPNLQEVVDAERQHMESNSIPLHNALMAGQTVELTAATIFSDWQTYATLSAYIKSLPGVTQLPSIGTTYQGNNIDAFKFGTGPYSVIYHGGIHAREWISPATVAYITSKLVNNTALLSQFTFYVMPVVNPDGYAYTRDPNGDRYQRKNMVPNSGSTCIGTDPNRNFNNHWSAPGASSDVCADDYYGTAAFSTAEATNIANFVQNTPNVVGYVDLHSYSELFMFANGYTCSGQVKDYATLLKGSQLAVAAIQGVNGEVFANGDICNTIYQASGSSVDYMYNNLGVKYAYTIELRPNQNSASGTAGFNPPATEIIPSGEETYAAFNALWSYVATQLSSASSTTTTTTTKTTTTAAKTTTTTTKATTVTTKTTSTTKTTGTTTTTKTTTTTTAGTTCAHAVCATGVALKSTCSTCAGQVCAADSYCCSTAWDSICVSEVPTYCGTGQGC